MMKKLFAVLLAVALALGVALPALATEEPTTEAPEITEPVTEEPPEEPGRKEQSLFMKILDVVGTVFFGILFSPLILGGILIFFGCFFALAIPGYLFNGIGDLFNWFFGLFK